ncbi:MAG: terminase [Actinobacteria bacterium]|nr:terminase [Actinomycetota bacterium]
MTSVLDGPAVSAEIRGCQVPLVRHVPDYAATSGPEVTELAARAGLFLDPWESDVLDDFLGEDGHGNWTSTENGLVVPRQNGKGSIVEARELGGLFLFREPLIMHTAHEVKTAGEAFLRILSLVSDTDEFRREVRRVNKSHGEEGIELRPQPTLILGPGGREIRRSVAPRLRFLARSRISGRGFSGRVVILDEAFELATAIMKALVPTMSAQALQNPQLWYTSTPPDQEKDHNAQVLAGVRKRALEGAPRLAWLEWGADVSHLAAMSAAEAERELIRMRRDPAVIARANPGLGIRLSMEFTVETELGALPPKGFDVERLGIGDWPPTDDESGWAVIPKDEWAALADPESKIPDGTPVAFAADADRSQAHGSIAVAGYRGDGRLHAEVADHRSGTAWIPVRLAELAAKYPVSAIVIDPKRQASPHIAECESLGLDITQPSAREMAQACGGLYVAACDTRSLAHLGQPPLDFALSRAVKRELADSWAFDAPRGVDISPLVAVTLAAWAAGAGQQQFFGSWR